MSTCIFVANNSVVTKRNISLASQPYFFRALRKTGEGERKNTSGNLFQVFVPPTGMLAEPMKLQNAFNEMETT